MDYKAIHARYRQVLEWQDQGLSVQEMSARLGVTWPRTHLLIQAATTWQRTVVERLHPDTPVTALPIRGSGVVGLRRAGLLTVGQVAALSDEDLLRIRGIGPGVLAQLRADLAARYENE